MKTDKLPLPSNVGQIEPEFLDPILPVHHSSPIPSTSNRNTEQITLDDTLNTQSDEDSSESEQEDDNTQSTPKSILRRGGRSFRNLPARTVRYQDNEVVRTPVGSQNQPTDDSQSSQLSDSSETDQ